ncbi:hypothetical protein [Actinoplanes palleronii]|uniref:Uncharacterized protein n=1 Tax=Actinoplanes palleronii TaxID=113570 RepID=A0ABQ4BHM5_9ACTN|nr:hypothetical protein [Actinoplanes palleronii]GIE69821.1 hypothetical protein Apa02nite_059290 [Actinoplanes palleronii]
MRGSTIAAVATFTLLAITGCANSDESAPAATAAGSANMAGFDKGTAGACTVADQATHGEEGRDLDLATARDIVTFGKTSKSTIITAATEVLNSSVAKAQAAAGEPNEAVLTAEVSSAILKVQTVCKDTEAVKASITTPSTVSDSEDATPGTVTDTKAN